MTKSVWVLALLLPVSGCALLGFDPLADDFEGGGSGGGSGDDSGGAGGNAGNTSPFGGSGGVPSGGMGGSAGVAGNGSGGTGGAAGAGGSGGVGQSDAGPAGPCDGKENFDDCDDGLYCTVDDFCLGGVCQSNDRRLCFQECNTSSCNEDLDACEHTPIENGESCQVVGQCIDGRCASAIFECGDGGECEPLCLGECAIGCQNATSCEVDCQGTSECATDCTGAKVCDFECADTSLCEVDCQSTGTCSGVCSGNSTCAILCTDASGCEGVRCLDEARCKIQCLEAESCGFAECSSGDEEQCPDGTVVCGAACDYAWQNWRQ